MCKILERLLEKKRKIKKYLLIVKGLIKKKIGEIKMPLITNKKQTPSLTTYSLITQFEKESLILASPVTGRKHQIRKHFSMIGHPIIGDDKFGAKESDYFFFILFILNLKVKMKK